MPTSNSLAVYIYFLALGGSGRIVRTLVDVFFDLAIYMTLYALIVGRRALKNPGLKVRVDEEQPSLAPAM